MSTDVQKFTRDQVWGQLATTLKHGATAGLGSIMVRSKIGVMVDSSADLEQWAAWFDAELRGVDVYDAQCRPGFVMRMTTAANPDWHGWELRITCIEYVPIEAVSPQLAPGGDR